MTWSLRKSVGALLLTGTVGVLACNETPVGLPTLPTAASIVVSTTSLSLPVGGSQTVSAQVIDSNGEVIADASIVWSSDNDPVASISAAGLITALDAGSATMTATHGALTATMAVTVTTVPQEGFIISQIDILTDSTEVDIAAGIPPGAFAPGVLVTFTASDKFGNELCTFSSGITAALRFDTGVLGVNTSLFGGPTCRILIAPGAQAGGTWLYLESGAVSDSIWVEVTNFGFAAGFSNVPAADVHVAGATVSYTVTIVDKNFDPVVGAVVQFDVTQGTTVAASPPPGAAAQPATPVTTDASGEATVDWTLPQSTDPPPGVLDADIMFTTSLRAGVVFDGIAAGAPAILPDVAASLVVLDITLGTDPDEFVLIPSAGTAQTPLGGPLDPTFLVQSLDQFGNELLETNVTFQVDDAALPLLVDNGSPFCAGFPGDDCADLEAPVEFELAPIATGTLSVTVTEGAASSVVNVNAFLGPVGVFELLDEIVVGQPQYASGLSPDGELLSDTDVYNNVDGVPTAFPTLSSDGTEVAFLIATGFGNWNIGVVASGGADKDDVATAVELLPDDNEASQRVGYPIFRGATGNEILFLSDRDPAKVLAGASNWDLYSLDRASGVVTKITSTVENPLGNVQFRGLSLSPDESKVAVTSADDHNPLNEIFSQAWEIDIATGTMTQITANTVLFNRHFSSSTYSPDGSLIYLEHNQGLLTFDGTNFRGVGESFQDQVSFDPTDANVFANLDLVFGAIRLYDVRDPADAIELFGVNSTTFGRDADTFSWSKR